jgi:UDP-N-acetylglucosamine acyltransferase
MQRREEFRSGATNFAVNPVSQAAAPTPIFSLLQSYLTSGAAMASAHSCQIHPTAWISSDAELAHDVVIGPYAVIEGKVRLGTGCVLRPFVHLCGPLTMGRNNQVYTGAVLGERPQHLHYHDEPTSVEIGDDNIFREGVTVHRGTKQSLVTKIGNSNFFMAHSHVAHDCRVGSHCLFANGALLGGHCIVEDNVFFSGNCAIHQFCHVGRLALLSGLSASTMDIPPFVIMQRINTVMGVNVIGMRRAGLSHRQVQAVRRAYHILYKSGKVVSVALAEIEHELGDIDVVKEFVDFIRASKRGISLSHHHEQSEAA